jgi:hypothetical protein
MANLSILKVYLIIKQYLLFYNKKLFYSVISLLLYENPFLFPNKDKRHSSLSRLGARSEIDDKGGKI